MSSEEELELSDLITQALELNGCLPKLRAELRASVFLALDEDTKINSQQPLLNSKVKSYLSTEEGPLMFCLIQEFLDFFNLDFTSSVFGAESYIGNFYKYEGRQKISQHLNLKHCNDDKPLISQIIKQMKCSRLSTSSHNNNNIDTNMAVNGDVFEKTDKNTEKKKQSHSKTAEDSFNGTYIVNDDLLHDSNTSSSSSNKTIETVNTDDNNIRENGTSEELNKSSTSSSGGSTSSSPHSKINREEMKSKTPSPTSSEKLMLKSPKNLYMDLPPIQLNKNRNSSNSDLLPSMCTKDLKEKLNSKEQEFGFDVELEYEEDFVSSSSDMELSANNIRKKLLENSGSKSNSISNHSLEKISVRSKEGDDKKSSNSTVISENLEVSASNSTSTSATNS